MRQRQIGSCALAALAAVVLNSFRPAAASTAALDRAMQPIVVQYEKIHQALAADSSKGVAAAALRIATLAAKLSDRAARVTGKHAAHLRKLPRKIELAAKKLSVAKAIASQREAFKQLSRPLALWATLSRPAGINVVYCSMAKGSWLQRKQAVANPYYGSRMLRCGEIVSGPRKSHASGHMAR